MPLRRMMKSELAEKKIHKIAIVYHVFAHYRAPILRQLKADFKGKADFVCISGIESDLPSMRLLDVEGEVGMKWERVKNRWIGSKVLWQSGLLERLWRGKYTDIVFLGQMNFATTWIAALGARVMGIRVLFWTHGVYGNEGKIKRMIRLLFCRLADAIMLYGHYARDLLLTSRFCSENLYVIYNSLDYSKQCKFRLTGDSGSFAALERKKELFPESPEYPVVVFLGRLTIEKRLDVLVSAASILKRNGVPVNVLFVGDGPERERLRQSAEKIGLGKTVRFLGACYDESKISVLINLSDVCVSPGNIGLTAMHSLVYGTPAITHDDRTRQMPEFEAIVEGSTGGFFRRGNSAALAEAIKAWTNPAVNRWENVSVACFRVVEECYNPRVQSTIFLAAVEGIPATQVHMPRSCDVVAR